MTDLDFRCTGARPEPYGASPTLLFGLRIEERDHQPVHAVALRCQIRIEPARRTYDPDETGPLGDLFGEPSRWSNTLKPLQFAHASITVPAFTGTTHVDLPVPCTYDTEVASASYFRALARGGIPLVMLFSGTVFTGRNGFRAEPIPWHKEASCLMPVEVWRDLIEAYFPNTGWLRLRGDCLESLRRYRSARALASWEQVVEELLATARADGSAGAKEAE
ncbi:hypothetical protein EES43_28395 [Streptomyces sp. ADI96-02]|uniref:DUF6084 family protein n=1 Tax=Streptomyces sp. ADI96-02 TaxID=1522760 RepID=UPI000F5571A8|nr:DUF6084 family protein [Streptomyces sp. ADI96-02]RPK54495.1 hypothetical protein EES43_28395 [Streptomyces sp. ADI96-02]